MLTSVKAGRERQVIESKAQGTSQESVGPMADTVIRQA